MEIVGIELKIDEVELVLFVQSLFAEKNIVLFDDDYNVKFTCYKNRIIKNSLIGDDFLNTKDYLGIYIHYNESEFPLQMELFRMNENQSERELFLALKISQKFNCKTIVGYMDETEYPYYSLIIDKEKTYLADDRGTLYCNEGTKKVKIIKEIKVEKHNFDEKGNII